MISEILATEQYVQQLHARFSSLKVPVYKLKSWYSITHHVFFDCAGSDALACLDTILKQPHFHGFTVFVVVKDPQDTWQMMDIHFRNIGSENLEHFIPRFHAALEPATKLSLQLAGSKYITCIGYSYSEE